MAFPTNPVDLDEHTEGTQTYVYNGTYNVWLKVATDDTPVSADTLPATDGSAGYSHVLSGHVTAPDGLYALIGTDWVQIG